MGLYLDQDIKTTITPYKMKFSVLTFITLAASSVYGSAIDVSVAKDVDSYVNLETRATCWKSDMQAVKDRIRHQPDQEGSTQKLPILLQMVGLDLPHTLSHPWSQCRPDHKILQVPARLVCNPIHHREVYFHQGCSHLCSCLQEAQKGPQNRHRRGSCRGHSFCLRYFLLSSFITFLTVARS